MTGILLRFAAKWALARLKEPSTYVGLFIFIGGHLGFYFSPELQSALTQTMIDGVGAALIALSGKDAVRHYAAASGEPVPNLPAVPTPAELARAASDIARQRDEPEPTANDFNAAELDIIRRRS